MKKLLTFVCVAMITSLAYAQEPVSPDDISEAANKIKLIDRLAFIGSIGSPTMDLNRSEYGLESIPGSFSLGELGIAYKLSDRVQVGISALGALGNCNSGYLDGENNFIPFNADDEDDEDEGEVEEGPECEGDQFDNIAGTITFKLIEGLYMQATAGYSAVADAPAFSALVGYSQNILSQLGVYLGLRYSNVIHNVPSEAVHVTSSSGLKAELGVNWNF